MSGFTLYAYACMYCFKRACVASGVSVSLMNIWPLSAGLCTFYTTFIYLFMLGKHLQNRWSQLPAPVCLSLGIAILLSLFLRILLIASSVAIHIFIELKLLTHVEIGKGSRVTKANIVCRSMPVCRSTVDIHTYIHAYIHHPDHVHD